MKIKRRNAIRTPKVLGEKGNIAFRDNASSGSNESYISSEENQKFDFHQQENIPPISSRLRSRSTTKTPKRTSNLLIPAKNDLYTSPVKKKKPTSTKSSTKSSGKRSSTSNIKTPTKKKINRIRSVLNSNDLTLSNLNSRYLLRSQSSLRRNICISPITNENNNVVFVTPKPPKKPLSELRKKSTPLKFKPEDLNASQLSDYSSSSAVSNTLLSRFVKNKSKMKKNENGRNWKHMRKIEMSQDSFDNMSSISVDEVAINRFSKMALDWYVYLNMFKNNFKTETKNRVAHFFQSLSSTSDPTQKILNLCNQTEIKSWHNFLEDPSNRTTRKIGEGVYGEVFRLLKGNVLKIFPVNGEMLVNGEDQMTMEDVFPELFVSKKLTELNRSNLSYSSPNFVQLKKATLVKGKLPNVLINHWKDFEEDKGTDNELLDFLPVYQNWMALEYEYAGEPLPEYKFPSRSITRCIIEQISLSLAVAESCMMFEHRDLHWLNILIKETKSKQISYKIQNCEYKTNCEGVFVTIIDFTVSRMFVDNNTVYMDMSDCPEIFEGEGDYQFDIYRMMKEDNNNNWREFHPKTNLYWIHYLIDKMIYEISYPRGDPDGRAKENDLRQLCSRVLTYRSARDLIENDPYFENCRIQDDYDSDNSGSDVNSESDYD